VDRMGDGEGGSDVDELIEVSSREGEGVGMA
jgi:hypothetical protein